MADDCVSTLQLSAVLRAGFKKKKRKRGLMFLEAQMQNLWCFVVIVRPPRPSVSLLGYALLVWRLNRFECCNCHGPVGKKKPATEIRTHVNLAFLEKTKAFTYDLFVRGQKQASCFYFLKVEPTSDCLTTLEGGAVLVIPHRDDFQNCTF